MTKPKKQIDEEADDTAHVDEDALEQIEIIHAAPKEYSFLVGKTLKPGEGVTHSLFSTSAEGEGEDLANEGEGEELPEKPDVPKHVFIDQVVRDKKMKFFKVPRLGSYLAVRLSYNSCLSDKAIEEAIADKLEVDKKREEQEAERKQYEEDVEADRDAKSKGDDEDGEEKIWEVIQEKEYLCNEQKYTVCLDTMGKDRTLSKDQIQFVLNLVKDYADTWQRAENQALRKDIEHKVEAAKKDREYNELEGDNTKIDEERFIDDRLAGREDIETDEHRDKETKVYKLEFYTKQLSGLTTDPETIDDESGSSKPPTAKGKDRGKVDDKKKKDEKKPADKKGKDAPKEKPKEKPKEAPKETHKEDKKEHEGEGDEEKIPERPRTPRLDSHNERWRQEILKLKEAKIIRFPRIFQGIFYLLGYKRDQICEDNTNKLWWKKAKSLINDEFFMKMFKYNPVGPKEDEYKLYQKINYIEKLISEIDVEAVENYSHTFVKLLNWLKLAIEVRREDVIKRILNTKRLKAERANAIEQEEERQKDRHAFYEDEKAKWEEEMEKKREAEAERKAREREAQEDDEDEDEFADYDEDGTT